MNKQLEFCTSMWSDFKVKKNKRRFPAPSSQIQVSSVSKVDNNDEDIEDNNGDIDEEANFSRRTIGFIFTVSLFCLTLVSDFIFLLFSRLTTRTLQDIGQCWFDRFRIEIEAIHVNYRISTTI